MSTTIEDITANIRRLHMASEGTSTLLDYEEPIEPFEGAQTSKDLLTQWGSWPRQLLEMPRLTLLKLLLPQLRSATVTLGGVEEARPTYRESPFDDLEELKDDSDKIRGMIKYVRGSSALPYAEQLASRLNLLAALAQEEPSELSLDSLRNLLSFLHSHRRLAYPDLVLTPAGNFRAEWRKASNRYLALEFLPEAASRFVLFAPNPDCPEKPYRISGSTSLEKLLEIAQLYGGLGWIQE